MVSSIFQCFPVLCNVYHYCAMSHSALASPCHFNFFVMFCSFFLSMFCNVYLYYAMSFFIIWFSTVWYEPLVCSADIMIYVLSDHQSKPMQIFHFNFFPREWSSCKSDINIFRAYDMSTNKIFTQNSRHSLPCKVVPKLLFKVVDTRFKRLTMNGWRYTEWTFSIMQDGVVGVVVDVDDHVHGVDGWR